MYIYFYRYTLAWYIHGYTSTMYIQVPCICRTSTYIWYIPCICMVYIENTGSRGQHRRLLSRDAALLAGLQVGPQAWETQLASELEALRVTGTVTSSPNTRNLNTVTMHNHCHNHTSYDTTLLTSMMA